MLKNINNQLVQGKIILYCGPMFAGKTTSLIKIFNNDIDHSIAIRPAYDTRWDILSSHNGEAIKSITIANLDELKLFIQNNPSIKNYLFDEIHFFTDPLFQGDLIAFLKSMSEDHLNCYAFGLDYNWKGEKFTLTDQLSQIADEVNILKGKCFFCGHPSERTKKDCETGGIFDIGADNLYKPSCLQCFG